MEEESRKGRSQSREKALKLWSCVPAILLGALTGLIVLLSMRVLYYDWMGYEPSMHPGIAFVFLPVLLFILLAVALPVEAILRWLISQPANRFQAFLLGVISASLLSWWAFPAHWYLVTVLNPLVLRLAVRGMVPARSNKVERGR